jgi:hypothetical protein
MLDDEPSHIIVFRDFFEDFCIYRISRFILFGRLDSELSEEYLLYLFGRIKIEELSRDFIYLSLSNLDI